MISLQPMTRELCRVYFRGFQSDPMIYFQADDYKPFVYREEWADAYFDRQAEKNRVLLAIMQEGWPIGEVVFKHINPKGRECTLSIHLQNDAVKGRGIGTAALRLALRFAFVDMGMKTVQADAILKNERSQHVLKKAGFLYTHASGGFRYYRCDRERFLNHLAGERL